MRCSRCDSVTVWKSPALCKEHFSARFEAEARRAIAEHGLFGKSDRVCVAASGGKDSTVLLFLLRKLGHDVTALAVDEGIAGYRDRSLEDLRKFCKEQGIPLTIVSFKEAIGKELDELLRNKTFSPCTVCGTFRRQLLNTHARAFDVLATGHNADDEAQAVLMNLCRANLALFPRGGPVTTSGGQPGGNGFVRRVKPLYSLTEKEVLTYAALHGLTSEWEECPYASRAYRDVIREALNAYEAQHPGAKRRVLEQYLEMKDGMRDAVPATRAVPCATCGEPCAGGSCKACRLREELSA